MVVGILNITLYIGGMTSLKDKRSVVKSILSKVRAKFNVSAAETGRQDDWKTVKWVFPAYQMRHRMLTACLPVSSGLLSQTHGLKSQISAPKRYPYSQTLFSLETY